MKQTSDFLCTGQGLGFQILTLDFPPSLHQLSGEDLKI